jgi:hypothetical protein
MSSKHNKNNVKTINIIDHHNGGSGESSPEPENSSIDTKSEEKFSTGTESEEKFSTGTESERDSSGEGDSIDTESEEKSSTGTQSGEESSTGTQSGGGFSDVESSIDTIEQLSADPLFLVLNNFLSSGNVNIVDAILKLNSTLEKYHRKIKKDKQRKFKSK